MVVSNRQITVDFGNGKIVTSTTDNLVKAIISSKALPTSLWVPSCVRHLSRDYTVNGGMLLPVYIAVVEQPPTTRTLQVATTKGLELFQVSLPYLVQVWVMRSSGDGFLVLDKTWALSFYRKLPLSGFSDELLVCNLPNTKLDPWDESNPAASVGWTCMHGAPDEVQFCELLMNESGESQAIRMAEMLSNYTVSAISTSDPETDTSWIATAAQVGGVGSFAEWEENSLANPQFGLTVDWLKHPYGATLGDVIQSLKESLGAVPIQNYQLGEPATMVAPYGSLGKQKLYNKLRGIGTVEGAHVSPDRKFF